MVSDNKKMEDFRQHNILIKYKVVQGVGEFWKTDDLWWLYYLKKKIEYK